jgi:hypothetical protein
VDFFDDSVGKELDVVVYNPLLRDTEFEDVKVSFILILVVS